MGSDTEYALYAVSQKARKEWLTSTNSLAYKEPIGRRAPAARRSAGEKDADIFPKMEKYAVRNAARKL